MRVISLKTLKAFWLKHPDAEEPLRAWFKVTTAAGWSNFMTVRNTFGSADTAKVNSGNTVTIFDIGGNKYRLITAIQGVARDCGESGIMEESNTRRMPWRWIFHLYQPRN